MYIPSDLSFCPCISHVGGCLVFVSFTLYTNILEMICRPIAAQRRWIKTVPLFVDNEFKESSSKRIAARVTNPVSLQVLGNTPQMDPTELDTVAERAQSAFNAWRDTPVSVRTRHVVRFGELVRQNHDALAQIVSEELGKTIDDAKASVFRGLEVVEHAYSTPSLIMGESLQTVSRNMDTYSFREPLGVVAGICPFNFPAMIPMWMFPLAAACGNTFILKPSEKVPLTCVRLMELVVEAGFPPGVINMVHGGKETVDWICDDPRIKAVSFVGGNQAGEYIHQRATNNNKRVQANLGAKNHCIVLPDADKEDALNAVVNAFLGSSGQRCMALSVIIFVGESQAWITDLVEKAKKFKPGVDYGALITKESKDRIESIISKVESQGGDILLDGRNPSGVSGNFLGPTVIDKAHPGMDAYDSEMFGPAAVCMRVDSLDEAVNVINSNKYGNGASIFTSNGSNARFFQANCNVGQLGINVPIPVALPMFSFTGWNASMRGDVYFNGKQGVNFYTRLKTVTARWNADAKYQTTLSGAFPVMK